MSSTARPAGSPPSRPPWPSQLLRSRPTSFISETHPSWLMTADLRAFWTLQNSPRTIRSPSRGPKNSGPTIRSLFWGAQRRARTVRSHFWEAPGVAPIVWAHFWGAREGTQTIRSPFLGVQRVTRIVRPPFWEAPRRARTISPHFLGARKTAPIVRPRFWRAPNRAPTVWSGVLGVPQGVLKGRSRRQSPDHTARPAQRLPIFTAWATARRRLWLLPRTALSRGRKRDEPM